MKKVSVKYGVFPHGFIFRLFPDEFNLHFTFYVHHLTRKNSDIFSVEHFIRETYEPSQDDLIMSIVPKVDVKYSDFILHLRYFNDLKDDDVGNSIGGLVVAVNEQKKTMLMPFQSIMELHIVLSAPMPKMLATRIKEILGEIQQVIRSQTNQIMIHAGGQQ